MRKLVFGLVLSLLLVGCNIVIEDSSNEKQEEAPTPESLGLEKMTVTKVVDGDTLYLSDGSKMRLIGLNAPENTKRVEPYGQEATNYVKSKILGKEVYLQKDVSDVDQYNRLLRIIWLEVPTDLMDENEIRKKMLNADMLINGYAEPYTFPPDVTYSKMFVKFAKEAREKEVGLWSYGYEGTTRGDLDKRK